MTEPNDIEALEGVDRDVEEVLDEIEDDSPDGENVEETDCLHCGGDGVEPYTIDEQCCICLGEGTVPDRVNREYHRRVMRALND